MPGYGLVMERLVTYDLALLLVDPARERFLVDSATLDHVLAAAALMDAMNAGVVSIDLGAKETKRRLRPTAKPPENPVLALVHGQSEKAKVKRLVSDLGGSTAMRGKDRTVRDLALHHLEGSGVVSTRKSKAFGSPRAPRVRVVDRRRREAALAEVRAALTGSRTPDAHTSVLAILLRSVGVDRKLFKDIDRKVLRARAEELAAGDWVRESVTEVVEAAAAKAAAEAAAAHHPGMAPTRDSGIS